MEHDNWPESRINRLAAERDRLSARVKELSEALADAVAAKDAELAAFERNLGRPPLVKTPWLDKAKAALQNARKE